MTDHPIPDDLVLIARRIHLERFDDGDSCECSDDEMLDQDTLAALAEWADGALIDPNGWRRLDTQELAAYCPVHGGIGAWDENGIYECDKADDERTCTVTPLHTIVERTDR